MHGVHGVCRLVPSRGHSAILIGAEKGSNTSGEMASSCTLTHCRCSSSSLSLPVPGRRSEGYWALADESATGHVHGPRFPCARGQSPWHVKSPTKSGLQEDAGVVAEQPASHLCSRELLPSETKFRSDRRDGVAVQHLNRPSENDRFLDLDMVGVELLETRGLREQLLCFLQP
jgi:hypothetical protein